MRCKHGFVYFVRAGHIGPIKIGRAENPGHRLAGLQTGNPFELRMLLLVRDQVLEEPLHAKFAAYRMKGEWFYPDDKLTEYIAQIRPLAIAKSIVNGDEVPVVEYRQLYEHDSRLVVGRLDECGDCGHPMYNRTDAEELLSLMVEDYKPSVYLPPIKPYTRREMMALGR